MSSLGEQYPKEQARCRRLHGIYTGLPHNAGAFAALMIGNALNEAENAAMSGDVTRMLRAFKAMQACEE